MAANQLAQTVRQQLGIGRVLPLGGPEDGAWITERAAAEVLRTAVGGLAGVRLGALRLAVADPDSAPEPAVPPPPSALPPGPLRIEADFAAVADRPLPAVAEGLRAALLAAADRELGLVVSTVDLRVSDLLEEGEAGGEGEAEGEGAGGGQAGPSPAGAETGPPSAEAGPADAPGGRTGSTASGLGGIAATALAVPGVARLAPVLGSLSRPVRVTDGHALIQLATTAGHRTLDVAAAVRAAVTSAMPAPLTVAVLVTAVEPGRTA
ncbi:hypothetical protein FCH28_22055 [Streptomyces piniterrae]|uniref:Nucleopolyhedrovirus P10 family protein n=1 Tax=Streptomyces piniterrae TaxID=2571125 RepID=A0A4U0NMA6_9ACTN|nr:hypothetical protein [Streptomyces piniterrae]TJZ51174.1 hypothetical protein FCH28_22055 [Streptomyces piniterrae]